MRLCTHCVIQEVGNYSEKLEETPDIMRKMFIETEAVIRYGYNGVQPSLGNIHTLLKETRLLRNYFYLSQVNFKEASEDSGI